MEDFRRKAEARRLSYAGPGGEKLSESDDSEDEAEEDELQQIFGNNVNNMPEPMEDPSDAEQHRDSVLEDAQKLPVLEKLFAYLGLFSMDDREERVKRRKMLGYEPLPQEVEPLPKSQTVPAAQWIGHRHVLTPPPNTEFNSVFRQRLKMRLSPKLLSTI